MRTERIKLLYGESALIKSGALQAKLKMVRNEAEKPTLENFIAKNNKTSMHESNTRIDINEDLISGKIFFEQEIVNFHLERNKTYSHYELVTSSKYELLTRRLNKNGQIKMDKKSKSQKYDHKIVGHNGINEIYIL